MARSSSATKTVSLLAVLACFYLFVGLVITPAVAQRTPNAGSVSLLSGRYLLSWTVSLNQTIATFNIDALTQGWVGLGWHELGEMGHDMRYTDIVVALFNANGSIASVGDYKVLGSNSQPTLDTDPSIGGQYNILSYSGSQSVDTTGKWHTKFSFTRAMNTNDSKGDHWYYNALQSYIYAMGTSNQFVQHRDADAGSVTLNIITGQVAKSHAGLPTVHGILMTIAFIVCMSSAATISRYAKQYDWWFHVHYALAGVGWIVMITGVVVACVMVGGFSLGHEHEWLGWITLIVAFCTPFMGIASHFMYTPDRIRTPVLPDMVHWWMGRLTLVLAYITILLGLIYVAAPFWIYILYAAAAATFIGVWLYFEIISVREKGWGSYWSVSYEYIGEPEEMGSLLTSKQ